MTTISPCNLSLPPRCLGNERDSPPKQANAETTHEYLFLIPTCRVAAMHNFQPENAIAEPDAC